MHGRVAFWPLNERLRLVSNPKIDALVERLSDWLPRNQREVRSKLLAVGADAVPALIHALEREDRGVHLPATELLGAIGDQRAAAPLIGLVRSRGSPMNRLAAANALAALGSEEAFEPLLELLREDDLATRDGAAEALGRLGDRRAVPVLIAMLEHEDDYARAGATKGLAHLGDSRAVIPLLDSRVHPWTRKCQRAEDALSAIGEAGVQPLREALDHAAWYVREGAAEMLGRLGDGASVEALIRLVEDPEPRVRIGAARALGRLGDPRAVEPLLRLRERVGSMRRRLVVGRALEALGWQPPAENDTAHLERLVDRQAWSEIAGFGAPAVPVLVKTARDPDYATRRRAIVTLGEIGDAAAVTDLVGYLQAKRPGIRIAAAVALGQIGDRMAVEPLLAALEGGDPLQLRCAAATALGRIGDRRAIGHLKPLTAARRDRPRELDLRAAAARALSALGLAPKRSADRVALGVAAADWGDLQSMGYHAVPALLAVLPAEPEVVQREIARVLGAIGDPSAAEPLIVWFFEHPCLILGRSALEPWVSAMSGLFGDYTDMLLRAASSISRRKIDRSTKYIDDYDWRYDRRMSNAGLGALCAVHTDVAVYLLHCVAEKRDAEVVLGYRENEWWAGQTEGILSFARQRRLARQELTRRGAPPANPGALRTLAAFRLAGS